VLVVSHSPARSSVRAALPELEIGRIVEIPILLRSTKRQVGLEETDGQKERLFPLGQVLQGLHGQGGQFAVRIALVRQIGHLGGRPLAAVPWFSGSA
jgi:hypothetical protein